MQTMERVVRLEVRNADTFGREYYSPRNEFAEILCTIKRKKGLSIDDIIILKNHGFECIFTGDKSIVIEAIFGKQSEDVKE